MSQSGPPEPNAPRTSRLRVIGLTAAVAALYTSLGVIDRRIGVVDPEAPGVLMAWVSSPRAPLPLPTAESQPWVSLFGLSDDAGPLVWAFTAVDSAMAVAYGLLLAGLLAGLKAGGDRAPTGLRLVTAPRPWLARVAAGSDLLENALLLAVFETGRDGGQLSAPLALATAVATLVKWGALMLAVVPLAWAAVAWGWRRVRRSRE